MEANEPLFQQRRNLDSVLWLSTLHKVTTTFWMIAYGSPADSSGDTLLMAKDTIIKCTKVFAETLVRVYGDQYPRSLNIEDITMLLAMYEAKGGHEMLGSVYCMHRRWQN